MPRLRSSALLLAAVAVLAARADSPRLASIDRLVEAEMAELRVPGMAVAVVRDGEVVHLGVYGLANLEWDAPVTASTAFQIASVTKLFTSTLVMRFIEQERIRLDDPVVRHLPDAPERWKDVSIAHLLSHQSGIPWPPSIGGFLGTGPGGTEGAVTQERIYEEMRAGDLAFRPGEKEDYLKGDAFVLQMVLEKVGGRPITEVFAAELFAPMGLSGTGFDDEVRRFPAQVMKPLRHRSQLFTRGKGGPLLFKNYYNPASYCSGGLYTTIEDAIRWAVALDMGTFVRPATVAQLARRTPLDGSFTALGWNRQVMGGREAFGHSGGPGLGDVLRFPEEKLTIIVLSNYADMYPYMAAAVARLFFPEIVAPAGPKTLERGFDRGR